MGLTDNLEIQSINFKLLTEEIFRELLQESINRNDIIKAMDERRVIAIDYEGEDVKPGYRYVEVYALGTTKSGNPCIIGWMRGNVTSKSIFNQNKHDRIHWRIYRLDKIKNWNFTKNTFDSSIDFMRKNRNYDLFNLAYNNLGSVNYKIVPDENGGIPPTKAPDPTKAPSNNETPTNNIEGVNDGIAN